MSNRDRLQQDNDDLMNIYNTAVNLPKYVNTSDANALAGDILSGKTAYVNSQKIIGTMSNLGDIDITPNVASQLYNGGYYNSINVLPVNSTIDTNITPENIANGVNILGIVGTLSGSEDLSNELNTQNLVISNLENQVNVLSDTLNNATMGNFNISELNQAQVYDLIQSDDGVNYSFGIMTLPINGQPYTGGPLCPNMQSSNMYYNMIRGINTMTNMDTSNVTNMNCMFSGFSGITSVPNFNTSNVTVMTSTFDRCSKLTTVPNFDTHNVNNMTDMFGKCSKLTTVPNFNTSNVINMADMFGGCYTLISAPNFDTSNVINMADMFGGCYNLISVPQLNATKVADMTGMFMECNNLSDASIQNIINMCLNSNVTNSQQMNLHNYNSYSIFNDTNISNTRYQNRWTELDAAGWSY